MAVKRLDSEKKDFFPLSSLPALTSLKSLLLSITTTCSASCTCCCERGAFFIGRIYVLRKADVTVRAIPETHGGRVIFFSFLDFLFFFYYDHIQRSYFLSLKQFIFKIYLPFFFYYRMFLPSHGEGAWIYSCYISVLTYWWWGSFCARWTTSREFVKCHWRARAD